VKVRAIVQCVGFRPLEPERGIYFGAALDAQARTLNDPPVVFLRDFALGTSKRLGHPRDIVALRFGDQAREHQQLAPLLGA